MISIKPQLIKEIREITKNELDLATKNSKYKWGQGKEIPEDVKEKLQLNTRKALNINSQVNEDKKEEIKNENAQSTKLECQKVIQDVKETKKLKVFKEQKEGKELKEPIDVKSTKNEGSAKLHNEEQHLITKEDHTSNYETIFIGVIFIAIVSYIILVTLRLKSII